MNGELDQHVSGAGPSGNHVSGPNNSNGMFLVLDPLLAISLLEPHQLIHPSGPSKGYNESLAQRLRETESVLLAVLGAAAESDPRLSCLQTLDVPESRQGDAIPSATERRIQLEDWESFPLRTRGDVLRWRDRRVERGGHWQEAEGLTDPGPEGSVVQGFAGDMDFDANEVSHLEHGICAGDLAKVQTVQIPGNGFRTCTRHRSRDVGLPQRSTILVWAPRNSIPSGQGRGQSSISTTASLSMGRGAGVFNLPKEFQDTFLW